MKVNYTLKKEDYVNFSISQMGRDGKTKRTMALQMVIPMAVALIILIFQLTQGRLKTSHGIFLLVFIVGWPIIYRTLFRHTIKSRLISYLDKHEDRLGLGPKTMEFTQEGIGSSGDFFPLSSLHKLEETPDYYFFFVSPTSALILPKRDLDPASDQALRKILEGVASK